MYKFPVKLTGVLVLLLMTFSCKNPKSENTTSKQDTAKKEFNYIADRFADIQVLRYQIPLSSLAIS